MFSTAPKPRHDVFVCTNISCSLRGADEFYEAMLAAAAERPRRQRALVRVPRRVRHRADGVGQRRVRRPARPSTTPSGSSRTCGGPPGARAQAAALPPRAPTRSGGRRHRVSDPRQPKAQSTSETSSCSTASTSPGSTRSRSTSAAAATRSLRKALTMAPEDVLSEPHGLRACAAAAAPASRWAARPSFLPHGDMDKYLVCNADESEPGTFKDRELMQKSPAHADRGDRHRGLRGRDQPRVHLHPRRVRARRPTSSRRRSPRPHARRLPRRRTSSAPSTR